MLGETDDLADPSLDQIECRLLHADRRNEHHRSVDFRCLRRLLRRRPHRPLQMRLARPLRIDAADDARAVVAHLLRPERALLAGDALHEHCFTAANDHARCPSPPHRRLHSIVHQVVRRDAEPRLHHRDRLVLAGAVDREDDRDFRFQLLPRLDHAFRHHVRPRERTAEIDQQTLHARVRQHEFERRFCLCVAFAADLHEVGRLAAEVADRVHRRHRQTRAIGQHADVAVQFDVLEVECLRPRLRAPSVCPGFPSSPASLCRGSAPSSTVELAIERDEIASPPSQPAG